MTTDDFETWAEFYDYLYRDKFEEAEDEAFYRNLVEECDGTALEIACGTGRLYVEYLADGNDIHGVDISEQMLARLTDKAEERGLEPTVHHGDAATVEFPTDYELVYLPFTALHHFDTLEHQRQLFRNVREHLTDGGQFAFDVPVPDFERVANEYGQLEVEEFERDGDAYRWEIWSVLTDRVEQDVEMHNRVINVDRGVIEWETTFELTLFPKQQLELLFDVAGFEEWEFRDGFSDAPVTDETERMVGIGRAPD